MIIRRKGQASTNGPMGSTIKVNGRMEKEVEMVCGSISKATVTMANGIMAKAMGTASMSLQVFIFLFRKKIQG